MSELAAYAAELRTRADQLEERASLAVRKAAMDTMRDAKILAPVDTGNLMNSITTDAAHGALRATVEATAEYATYQEFGTWKMAAQPFMGPAADRHEPPFLEAIQRLAEGD